MIQVAFADTPNVLVVRAGDVVGEGWSSQSETGLQGSDVVPVDAPGDGLRVGDDRKCDEEEDQTTPNNPTIQRSKESHPNDLGGRLGN